MSCSAFSVLMNVCRRIQTKFHPILRITKSNLFRFVLELFSEDGWLQSEKHSSELFRLHLRPKGRKWRRKSSPGSESAYVRSALETSNTKSPSGFTLLMACLYRSKLLNESHNCSSEYFVLILHAMNAFIAVMVPVIWNCLRTN